MVYWAKHERSNLENYQTTKCCAVLSHVQIFATPWIVTCQVPLSMAYSRQEYRSGLPFLSPGDLPDPGIEPASPVSPALQADSLPSKPSGYPFLRIDRLITHRGQSGHIGPAGGRSVAPVMCVPVGLSVCLTPTWCGPATLCLPHKCRLLLTGGP